MVVGDSDLSGGKEGVLLPGNVGAGSVFPLALALAILSLTVAGCTAPPMPTAT